MVVMLVVEAEQVKVKTKARAEKRTLVVCIMETEVGGEKKNDAVDRRERGCQWARISKHGVKRLTVKECTNNSEKTNATP